MVTQQDSLWWTDVRPEPRPPRSTSPRPRRKREQRQQALEPPFYAYVEHPEALSATTYDKRGFYVYRVKDALGKILYIGYTSRHPVDRLTDHRSRHDHRLARRLTGEPWLHLAASMDWAELPTEELGRLEEQRQIAHHNPVGNVHHSLTVVTMARRKR